MNENCRERAEAKLRNVNWKGWKERRVFENTANTETYGKL
jgi:hypothetical protein